MESKKLARFNSSILSFFLLLLDYLVVLLAEQLALAVRNFLLPEVFTIRWIDFWLAFPAPFLFFLWLSRLYVRRMSFYREVEHIFYGCLYATLSLVFFLYAGKTAAFTSRFFIVGFGILSFCFISAVRYLVKRYLIRRRLLLTPVLIIGAGETAELLVRFISGDAGMGYEIVGLLEDNQPKRGILDDYPVLGTLGDAERVIRETGVRRVFIAIPGMDGYRQGELIFRIQPLVEDIFVVPNLVGVPVGSIEVESFYDAKLVVLGLRNNLSQPLNRMVKGIFDFVVTFLGTLLVLPLLAIIAIWIRCDSPGPVIFRHTRVGKNGKKFKCLKFRTMNVDAPKKLDEFLAGSAEARAEWENTFKLKNDPRVTRCGAILRRTSLDELPQIFNVLAGDMSLVGPRPITEKEVSLFGDLARDRMLVKPGITGMWQVSGRSDVEYGERVIMDVWYVRNWSVWLDIVILYKTLMVVLKGRGAY